MFGVVDGVVLFGQRGTVYAVDAGTGEQVWFESGVSSISLGIDSVYLVGDNSTRRVRANTGEQVWKIDVELAASPPVAFGEYVVGSAVADDGTQLIYNLFRSTGDQVWQVQRREPDQFALSLPGATFHVTSEGVYVGGNTVRLYEWNDRRVKAKANVVGGFDAVETTREYVFFRGVVQRDRDYRDDLYPVYGMRRQTAEVEWQTYVPAQVNFLGTTNDKVYLHNTGDVYAFAGAELGHTVWKHTPPGAIINGVVDTFDVITSLSSRDASGLAAYDRRSVDEF